MDDVTFLYEIAHACLLCRTGCCGISLPNLTTPDAHISLKFVRRATLRMRLPPLYSHRDAAIDAFRRKQMTAVPRFIDFLSD